MKAFVASSVVVAVVAIGMLLLVRHLARVPVLEARLATHEVATIPIFDPGIAAASPVVEPRAVAAVLPTRTSPDQAHLSASLPGATIRSLPTRTVPALPSPTAPSRELLEAWAAPTALPTFSTTPREGCDPAYPDEDTCIPPGPPFDQGCAITDERRFTVLPPDPQGLDHDSDRIGCEPMGSD